MPNTRYSLTVTYNSARKIHRDKAIEWIVTSVLGPSALDEADFDLKRGSYAERNRKTGRYHTIETFAREVIYRDLTHAEAGYCLNALKQHLTFPCQLTIRP